MLGHPEGRGNWHGHTNFRQKLNLGIFQNSGVAYDLERLFKKFSDIFGQPERPYPFLLQENGWIFWFLLH